MISAIEIIVVIEEMEDASGEETGAEITEIIGMIGGVVVAAKKKNLIEEMILVEMSRPVLLNQTAKMLSQRRK
jgi:hypothetical protein